MKEKPSDLTPCQVLFRELPGELPGEAPKESFAQDNPICWKIRPLFFSPHVDEEISRFIRQIEERINGWITGVKDLQSWVDNHLPLIQHEIAETTPGFFSFFFIVPQSHESDLQGTLRALIHRRFLGDVHPNIVSFESFPFSFVDYKRRAYLYSHVKVLLEDEEQLVLAQQSFPEVIQAVQDLAKNGSLQTFSLLCSDFSASSEKVHMISQRLTYLRRRWPGSLGQDIFSDLSEFLTIYGEDFLAKRDARHITRLLCRSYFTCKKIALERAHFPDQTVLSVCVLPTSVLFHHEWRPILAIHIVMNAPPWDTIIHESQLLKLIQYTLPQVEWITESFHLHTKKGNKVQTLYAEVLSKEKHRFSLQEVRSLQSRLSLCLGNSTIKMNLPCMSVKSNADSLLSREDLERLWKKGESRCCLSLYFERMEREKALFSWRCVCHKEDAVIGDALSPCSSYRIDIHQQSQSSDGSSVCMSGQVKCDAQQFLNIDGVVDTPQMDHNLWKEMKSLWRSCERHGGEYITSMYQWAQNLLKGVFSLKEGQDKKLWEGEFSDIKLTLIRSLAYSFQSFPEGNVPPDLFAWFAQQIISIHQKGVSKVRSYELVSSEEGGWSCVVVCSYHDECNKLIKEELLSKKDSGITQSSVFFDGMQVTVLLCNGRDERRSAENSPLVSSVQRILEAWTLSRKRKAPLYLDMVPVSSLDPRSEGAFHAGHVLRMTLEGLMRMGENRNLTYGMAKKVEISPNQKVYRFHLHPAKWSDGRPVTAGDFLHSWSSLLHPKFPSRDAWKLYPILNAREVKEGLMDIDQLGVKIESDYLLTIHLQKPDSSFLELTTQLPYYPLPRWVSDLNPFSTAQFPINYPSNGPFYIEERCSASIRLRKNPSYVHADEVSLEEVVITHSDSHSALQNFRSQKLSWLGRPFRPWEDIFSSIKDCVMKHVPSSIYWYFLNTRKFPFTHASFRKALSLAVDHFVLLREFSHLGIPAFSCIPTEDAFEEVRPYIERFDSAKSELQKFLDEVRIEIDQLPPITLSVLQVDDYEHLAQSVCQQWKNVLGIHVHVEALPWSSLAHSLFKGSFDIAGTMWISVLEMELWSLFRDNGINNPSRWSSSEYQSMLSKCLTTTNTMARDRYLKKLSIILEQETPVIPIFTPIHRHAAQPHLKGVVVPSHNENVDFKWAYWDD